MPCAATASKSARTRASGTPRRCPLVIPREGGESVHPEWAEPRPVGSNGRGRGGSRTAPTPHAKIAVLEGCEISHCTHGARLDCGARRARPQPQEYRRRPSPRPAGRHYRPVGVGQVLAGLRHDLRRRTAALCRIAVLLRPPVPRADGEAGRRSHRRPVARHRHRAEDDRLRTRARPSAPSPRSTITSGCSSPTSAYRIATSAAARSPPSRSSASSTW